MTWLILINARSVISFIDALLQTGWHTYDEIILKIEKSDKVELRDYPLGRYKTTSIKFENYHVKRK